MTASTLAVVSPKKLIEVALPLDAINDACGYEKKPGIGAHPRGLHLWWARRPLAAARAVIFGQLVDDPEDLWRIQNPGIHPKSQNKSAWTRERLRLFKIIEDMVLWENTTNERVLEAAREEIRKSWKITCKLNRDHPQADQLFNPNKMPGLHDPFAGGGAIPLEAQRLGLEAYASDLNPVAVLINKAMIEIPPKFAGQPPIGPEIESKADKNKGKKLNLQEDWEGAAGLAEDVRRYGRWIRDEAEKRIGHLYPKVEVTAEMAKNRPDLEPYVGKKLTVYTWLWARTVKSPNPAFSHVDVPLASSFVLSSKKGREAHVVPIVGKDGFELAVKVGKPPADAKGGTTAGKRKAFRCLMSDVAISYDHIRREGRAGRMGQKLMAIVAEGDRGRVYLSPVQFHEDLAAKAKADWRPDNPLPNNPRDFKTPNYGMTTFGDLFTERQLVALTTFSDLVGEARERIEQDAVAAGRPDDDTALEAGGTGAKAYAEAVSVYHAFAIDRLADYASSIATWKPSGEQVMQTFKRQALPMTWDFPESNILGEKAICWLKAIKYTSESIPLAVHANGRSVQRDAASTAGRDRHIISTDPPYYDNIGYADLSDFFYVWLRRTLRQTFSSLLATIDVPKSEELIAAPYRQGGQQIAEMYFLDGMTNAMRELSKNANPAIPTTIYYAFKQSETKDDLTQSTGWQTFLNAVLSAGFSLSGTWPLRTEGADRIIARDANALASSILLVCRPRSETAGTIGRRQFIRQLNETLPAALDAMTRESEGLHSPVAPVDLSQAIIGPGMAIFSKYDAVLEADGTPMTVKTALQLINRFLAEDDFDADTQFCLHWFDQYGWEAGKFGEADTLARAKGTSVDGVKDAGVIDSGGGSVRLLRWKEYPSDWDPRHDHRLPVWEVLHHMIRVYQTQGDNGAAEILAAVASKAEAARQLAYRLYTLCERKRWAEDARAYNAVVAGWNMIEQTAAKVAKPEERSLFEAEEVS